MQINNQRDFVAGLLFAAFGAMFALMATRYQMGAASRMGPGYFPLGLGALLFIVGAIVAIRAALPTALMTRIERPRWSAPLLILGAVVVFAIALRPIGLIGAIIFTAMVSSAASDRFSWRTSLVTGVLLAVFCTLLFVWALGLLFPVLPAFLN